MNRKSIIVLLSLTLIILPLMIGCARRPMAPNYVYATGLGVPEQGRNPAQAKAMARRAARIDAERQPAPTH